MRCALFLYCFEFCATCGHVAVATTTPTNNSTALHFTSLSPHSASIDLQFQKVKKQRRVGKSRSSHLGQKKQHTLIGFLILSSLLLPYLTLPHFTLSYHLKLYLLLLIFFSDEYPMIPYLGNNAPTVALLC